MVEQLALALANALHATEAFEVRESDIGQYSVVWLGYRAEQSNLALCACSHLHHAKLGLAIHCKECERYANVVVEVALGGRDLELLCQDSRYKLLGSGLTIATRNGYDWYRQATTMFAGQCLQCL